MYIKASSTISHQPTFQNEGFSSGLSALNSPSHILHPDYSDFIPKMKRRRMSDVLKMSIACTKDCLLNSGVEQPEAIIVGTSMGCPFYTQKFLDKIIASDGGLISPTAFILSTHNTIAGQISLMLGNHNYNMTHTQGSLSFEQALTDAMLCIKDGCSSVLVGAADEQGEALYNMSARLNTEIANYACGASFFILSSETSDQKPVSLVDVRSFGLIDNLPGAIHEFFNSNSLSESDVDLVLFSSSRQKNEDELNEMFYGKIIDYQKYAGWYFTNSAFAMDYGADLLRQGTGPSGRKNLKQILICNNLVPENLGLILMEV